MTIERDEFEARMGGQKEDLTALGNTMRKNMDTFRTEVRDDFKSVWKAMNGMLIKVGIIVTICSSLVLAIFKMIEVSK